MPVRKYKSQKLDHPPIVFFKGHENELNQKSGFRLTQKILESQQLKEWLKAFPVGNANVGNAKTTLQKFKALVNTELKKIRQQKTRNSIIRAETPNGHFWFNITRSKNGIVTMRLQPVYHGIHAGKDISSWEMLNKILGEGFKGTQPPNVIAKLKHSKLTLDATIDPTPGITCRDHYNIELLAPVSYTNQHDITHHNEDFVRQATPRQISRINIILSDRVTDTEREAKKAFYRKALKGHNLRFFKLFDDTKPI